MRSAFRIEPLLCSLPNPPKAPIEGAVPEPVVLVFDPPPNKLIVGAVPVVDGWFEPKGLENDANPPFRGSDIVRDKK